ncbi:MAG TPA: CopD family protein, partial [Anaerolineaceae bacterium]|nr:CopD family protein [Anaerolineaceae bacterium]
AAGVTGDPLLPLLAEGLHLLSIGLWAGGVLALLVLALRPRLLDAALVRRFTPRAMLYVGLTFASGLFSSAQQVASLDALFFTPYGQALLVKVGLVLGVGALGLINMRIAKLKNDPTGSPPVDGAGERHWRARFIAIEGALMLAVLGMTALLTSSAPANTVEYRLAGVQQPESLSQTVDDVLVSFSARPNRPGQNILSVRANSTRRPAPAEIQRVILRLRYLEQDLGQVTVEAEALEGSSGQYQAGGSALSLPGRWEVEVVVRRKGLLDSVASFTWVVYPFADMPPVRVAAFPLAWLALPAAGAALLGVGFLIARRGRKIVDRG